MAYRQRKPKKQFISQQEWKAEAPTDSRVGKESAYFEYKAFRNLQNAGNIEVKADPNSPASLSGYPYRVINKMNKVVDAKYVGVDNIDGNILTRLQNSNDSRLLYTYDLVTLNERVNYLYLNYQQDNVNNHNNLAMNVEMHKAVTEAFAKGYSTMLTQLPFYTGSVDSDAPNPYSSGTANYDSYNKMMAVLHYQTVLQNAVAPISKYIQTRSLEQTLMNMSYRREAPLVASLYGLLKKAAFISTLESISTAVIGEYFDTEWYKQTNTLMFMASRKSNSITDPLITSTCTTNVPEIKLYAAGTATPYYDYQTSMVITDAKYFDPDTFTLIEHATLNFEQLIYLILRFLDVSTILRWARLASDANNTLPSAVKTASGYYENNINKLVSYINNILSRFSSYMTEIRTFLDKLDESGMVYWKKGITFKVADIKVFEPDYNIILNDTITAFCGGASDVSYDTDTLRWKVLTLWNKYTGVNRFDKRSGGSFLTFGLRTLVNAAANTDISYCVPIIFSNAISGPTVYFDITSSVTASNYSTYVSGGLYTKSGSTYTKITTEAYDAQQTYYIVSPQPNATIQVTAINRYGEAIEIVPTATNIGSNASLARLDALGQNIQIKIPTVTITTSGETATVRATRQSSVLYLLNNLFGYGKCVHNSTTESVVNSDYVCFIDIEMDDISNETIQFCRNYSPFRISTPDGSRSIGFSASTKLGSKN